MCYSQDSTCVSSVEPCINMEITNPYFSQSLIDLGPNFAFFPDYMHTLSCHRHRWEFSVVKVIFNAAENELSRETASLSLRA